ncbi:MAG: NADH-quinone oxidoreductase subunit NuoH [Phycisphaerae bacterium]|nr:NADH-quinone oxidoreductase subunit NuoH [Phycisphaerae bacterium]
MTQMSVPWKPGEPVEYRGVKALIVGLSKVVYAIGRPILSRLAFPIFVCSVFGIALLVFATTLLFGFVDDRLIETATNGPELGLAGGELTVAEIAAGLEAAGVWWTGLLKYLFWPVQYAIVRDIIISLGIFCFALVTPAFAIWWERKSAGRIQSRPGPMRVGNWHGWAQPPADGIKLLQKEDLVPADADGPLFRIAPYLVYIPVMAAFATLPFGSYWVFRNLDVGLLLILAMLGIEVIGVVVAGWASHSKWAIYGAMREACHMVSYEIPMGMALLIPVMCVGSLSLVDIGGAQDGGWHTWLVFRNPFTFGAALIYFIASLASCKRAPFDLPEGESELVAGFLTEYSGFRWALFFFAEYTAMFVVAGLMVVLFLGGWHSPLPASWGAQLGDGVIGRAIKGLIFSGPALFIIKGYLMIFVQIWIRWTLPRIRIDQVLYACVQVMLPVVMVLLLCNTVWELFFPPDSIVAIVFNVIMALIGAVVVVSFLVVMARGFINRRREVGYLAVDLMPGG